MTCIVYSPTRGTVFPNVDSRAASVMNSDNNLKSPEELEEEDRAAQGAKLQELIRRERRKTLLSSGAHEDHVRRRTGQQAGLHQQTRRELDKVQSRAILLNDMLNNAKEGEKFVQGDAYDQIASHLRSVQPRIQKWIGDVEEGGNGMRPRGRGRRITWTDAAGERSDQPGRREGINSLPRATIRPRCTSIRVSTRARGVQMRYPPPRSQILSASMTIRLPKSPSKLVRVPGPATSWTTLPR